MSVRVATYEIVVSDRNGINLNISNIKKSINYYKRALIFQVLFEGSYIFNVILVTMLYLDYSPIIKVYNC